MYHRRQGHQRSEESPTVRLSKGLSWLLRHNAPKESMTVHLGGFVDVDVILNHQRFKGFTVDDIRRVVEENDKERFTMRTSEDTGKLQVRANQGHSFEVEGLELEEITNAEDVPVVVHGTYFDAWEGIKKRGLSRMRRNHIHFATGIVGCDEVISGMRRSAQVYIYIDLTKSLNDRVQFFRSKNNVILCPGNEKGYLETKYFSKVVDAKTGALLHH